MSQGERAEWMGAGDGRRWLMLAFWLAIVAAIALVGSWVTLPKIPTWYAGLAKPSFAPPNAVFGPVWSILYLSMAVAAWRIGEVAVAAARTRAIALFAAQLALNAFWPVVFFGLQAPRLGFVTIVLLLFALTATLAAFWRIDRPAGLLLAPYLAWVGYATALNAAIVALN